jgi:four helix bundle protein
MQDYRKLDVWTKAHDLALDVHRLAATRCRGTDAAEGERGEASADAAAEVCADVRQAALRVPVLLVVGCEAETAPEFARAMREAATAVDELAYRLRFARDAGVLDAVPYAKLEARAHQLRAMLGALNRTVRLKLGAEARAATGSAPRRAAATEGMAPQAAVARAMRGVRDDGSSRPRSRPRSTS